MKKQIKKLSLSKRTISNLQQHEMANKVGGGSQGYCQSEFCGYSNGNKRTCYKTLCVGCSY